MAEDNKIPLEVEVDGVEQSINSLKELRTAVKAAKDEQVKAAAAYGESSKQYKQATQRVSELTDKVDDLTDSTKSLQGSGVERASAGFNLLGEGLRNLDFDKVKVGLTAMKTALAAVGIGLIVQAVMYLVENFKELSEGSGVVAKALQFVGSIITSVTDKIAEFTDYLGLTNTALDKLGDSIVTNANAAKDALAGQTAEYDRQIAVAKASGQNSVDLEKAKQQAIIDTNKALIEQTIAYVRGGGVLKEEQKKLLTEQMEAIKNAVTTQKVIEITHTADLKKENDTRLADKKKQYDDELAARNAQFAKELQMRVDNSNLLATIDEQKRLEEKAKQDAWMEEAALATDEGEAQKITSQNLTQQLKDDQRKQDLEDYKTNYASQLQIAQATTQSLQSLSDLFFTVKNRNLQKGTAAELKAAEQQFKINKALAITSAVISGIQGVINALSAQSVIPEPFGTILKVASAVGIGIAAAANVAKIASTKFSVSGGGGGGGAALPSAPPIPAPPSISTQDNNTNKGTSFDENGKRIGGEEQKQPVIQVKATVGVNEVADKQNRVDTLEKQSTF
jgi:hypothetical protein